MILVTGSVLAREDTLDELLALSLAHVERSRREPGCLAHAVHVDAEDPLRLVFVERWQSREALGAHFRLPESGEFVAALRALVAEPPSLDVYEAERIEIS